MKCNPNIISYAQNITVTPARPCFNPIRSGLFQTVKDPGGGFKSPPPPTISKSIVSIFTISYM